MPFRKGESGNPGGRPKEIAEIKALARQHGPAAIQKLVEYLDGSDGKLSQAAAIALLDRGYGKPTQSMDLAIAQKTHEEWLAELNAMTYEVDQRKKAEAEKETTIAELKGAIEEIKTLRGIIPRLRGASRRQNGAV